MYHLNYNGEDLTVYEHSDLTDEFIINLANHIKSLGYDSREVRGKYKKLKRIDKFYNDYGCYDTEVSTAYIPVLGEYHGIPYLQQLLVGGKLIILRRTSETFEFIERLTNHLQPSIKYVIYVHNLKYEFQFMKEYLSLKGFFSKEGREILYCEDKNNQIQFRCSLYFSNMGLGLFVKKYGDSRYSKLKEIMDYDALRTPNTQLDENTLLYSVMDVVILKNALDNYMKVHNVKLVECKYTSTSIMERDMKLGIEETVAESNRERKLKGQRPTNPPRELFLKTKLDYQTYILTERCKGGGNTHANAIHVGEVVKDVGHCDLRSAHPSNMICSDYFTLSPYIIDERIREFESGLEQIDYIYDLLENQRQTSIMTFVIKNIRLKPRKADPTISISSNAIHDYRDYSTNIVDNGRLVSYTGTLTMTFKSLEFFVRVYPNYDWDDIYVTELRNATRGFLPDWFKKEIMKLYEEKTIMKGSDKDMSLSEEERAVNGFLIVKVKNKLNGTFGLCYKNPVNFETTFGEDLSVTTDSFNIFLPSNEAIVTEKLEKHYADKNKFLPYQWGSEIAMMTRCLLEMYINLIDYDDILYWDTDSIFYKNRLKYEKKIEELGDKMFKYTESFNIQPIAKDKKGKIKKMGVMDFEENLDAFVTIGAKKYGTYIKENEQREQLEYERILKEEPDKAETYKNNMKHGFECTIAGINKDKGSILIGSVDNFKTHMHFGTDLGKLAHRYNDLDTHKIVKLETGEEVEISNNVALTKVEVDVKMGDEFIEFVGMTQDEYYIFEREDN